MSPDHSSPDGQSESECVDSSGTERSQRIRSKCGRRGYLAAAGATGTALLSGCLGTLGGEDETVTFLLLPTENPVEVKQQFRPALDYVESQVDGMTFELDVATDYSAVMPAMESGQAELSLDDATMLEAPDMFDVYGITVAAGAPVYFSHILTTEDSEYESLEDLEGATIGFADRLSTSGSLFPLYALSNAGLDVGNAPDGDAVDFNGQWSNHTEARESLISRDEVTACGTSVGRAIEHVQPDDLPDRVRQKEYFDIAGTQEPTLEVLHVSEPIPETPIIARSDWESDNRDAIQQAFFDMTADDVEEHAEVDMNQVEISGVEPGDMSDYDIVFDIMNELDLDPGR